MTVRKAFFWLHLIAGTVAGLVILSMSVTGVMLAFEKQIIAWVDGGYRVTPSPGVARLPVEMLLAKIREARSTLPGTFTVRADPAAPAEAGFGRERTVFINPYTGDVLGDGSQKARTFFSAITEWHRWLGASVESRSTGRAVTGACNLAFLFLVASGFYLWWPPRWTWRHLKTIILFRPRLAGRQRDWSWHNAAGFWSAVPLFIIVLSGVLMSYSWANDLLFRLTGNAPPSRPDAVVRVRTPGRASAPSRGQRPNAAPPANLKLDGFNTLWARAEQQVSGWQSIILRLPSSDIAPVTFLIDQGNGGRPDKRAQLTFDRQAGNAVKWETFASYNLGRQLRTWARWAHTGEAGGLSGQAVAGLASAGGGLLVWTGLAMAWRRFRAWVLRRRSQARALDHEIELEIPEHSLGGTR